MQQAVGCISRPGLQDTYLHECHDIHAQCCSQEGQSPGEQTCRRLRFLPLIAHALPMQLLNTVTD